MGDKLIRGLRRQGHRRHRQRTNKAYRIEHGDGAHGGRQLENQSEHELYLRHLPGSDEQHWNCDRWIDDQPDRRKCCLGRQSMDGLHAGDRYGHRLAAITPRHVEHRHSFVIRDGHRAERNLNLQTLPRRFRERGELRGGLLRAREHGDQRDNHRSHREQRYSNPRAGYAGFPIAGQRKSHQRYGMDSV